MLEKANRAIIMSQLVPGLVKTIRLTALVLSPLCWQPWKWVFISYIYILHIYLI